MKMAHGQPLPRVAEDYHRLQQIEMGAAARTARRHWASVSPGGIDASWEAAGPAIYGAVTTGQARVSDRVPGYMSGVLRATGQSRWDDPFVTPLRRSLVGTAGDGRPVASLLGLAPILSKQLIASGVPAPIALHRVGGWVEKVTRTVVADTARQTEKVEMSVRSIPYYVRIVNAGACSRCAILAGRRYRMAEPFDRHPNCMCEHIPLGTESEWEEWQLDPQGYFDSLTEAEQNRAFTVAGAEAIRAGADPALVVNARRGMSTAQQNLRGWIPQGRLTSVDVYGRQVFTTTESTTRRGSANYQRSGRRRNSPRLMPESIVELAGSDRAELTRLLRLHGYLS